MRRRSLLQSLPAALAAALLPAVPRARSAERVLGTLGRPAEQWRGQVSAEAYAVLFDEDTERAFSSPLNREKRAGTYLCAACHLPLFPSKTKFDSGTGWPSFWAPLPDAVGTKSDRLLLIERTEYHCKRCGGHQGHVFDDGPPPTGQRYCNNGLALRFVPEGDALPELRS